MRVFSPMPRGNGAYIVHKILEQHIAGYQVCGYNPYRTVIPPTLRWLNSSGKSAKIVHTTVDYGCFFRQPKKPLLLTCHNFVLDELMRPYSSRLQWAHYRTDLKYFIKKSLRAATTVTAVSQFTAELVRSELSYKDEILVIPNGVNLEKFSPRPREEKETIRLLFSGNPTLRKGVHWLPEIADRVSDNVLILYTQGLRSNASVPDHPKLKCIGAVPFAEMPELYQSVDILLMPTVREGMSLAVLEAMACGLPIIATDCSSMSELVAENLGGHLCKLGDVDAFAERINVLAMDRDKRLQMGRFNRQRVLTEYNLEKVVGAYKAVIDCLG